MASRAGFFVFCVLLVIVWAPSFLVLPSIDTWQLVINTATTIITFLLVALLQNTERRADAAVQQKLNAIADALATAAARNCATRSASSSARARTEADLVTGSTYRIGLPPVTASRAPEM
ncbi:Predicted small integral membrane protein [Mycobacteroides abscessus subsp. abscessus]|nr:Predicted small integral membrane protein [Mycobacteroides abscessus subsp. abscessus]